MFRNAALPFVAAVALTASAGFALAAAPVKTVTTSAGEVYANEAGMTLYTFDKDEPGKSHCNDQCAVNWPPVMAAADAVAEGDWTLADRDDGTKMWAYKGMPVYLWINDTKEGDITGDGVGGVWHIIKP